MKNDAHAASKVLQLLVPSTVTTLRTGAAIDVSKYHGIAKIMAQCSSLVGGGSITISIEDSDDGSTGWVTRATFNSFSAGSSSIVNQYVLDLRGLKKFIRAIGTPNGTVSSTNYGVNGLFPRLANFPSG